MPSAPHLRVPTSRYNLFKLIELDEEGMPMASEDVEGKCRSVGNRCD